MKTLTITAAALAVGFLFQTQCFAQISTPTASDPESQARETWRAFMAKNNSPSQKGCYHVTYPNALWESTDCKMAQPRVRFMRGKASYTGLEVAGTGGDYIAQVQGLISAAYGSFAVSGVSSESSVGTAIFNNGGILGPNEYTLQLNTNANQTTAACAGHSGCTVWQQFVYATDYYEAGEAALFMQYWLIGWGTSECPIGWRPSEGDCVLNSASMAVPDFPITDLGSMRLSAGATAGGYDDAAVFNGNEGWLIFAEDDAVDIATVWNLVEFNVLGDTGGSEADFNYGSNITITLQLSDGSSSPPLCLGGISETGESNNLLLGSCQTSVSAVGPEMVFNEYLPAKRIYIPPDPFFPVEPVSYTFSK
jgi:hypothetical protein